MGRALSSGESWTKGVARGSDVAAMRDGVVPPQIPDFTLLSLIGQGSYGDVWLGRGVTGVFRAVKVVRRASFVQEKPFLREFEGVTRFASISVQEPSQLAVLHAGWGEDRTFFYYVMELADDVVTGRAIDPGAYVPLTLTELMVREGRQGTKKTLEIGQALARSLATLHRNGLVHRDVKPSNIVFIGGVPKLADIGLVALAEEGRTFVGTEAYAAPEGPGKPAADVFGASRILYELWTGKASVDWPEGLETFSQDRDGSELASVLSKGCARTVTERYQDGQALLEELMLLQAGGSVKRLRQAERNSKRWRTLLGVSLAVGVVAGIAAVAAIQVERLRTREEVALRKAAEAERDRIAAQSVYASEVGQAQRALVDNDYGAARRHLKEALPKGDPYHLKGFEWDLYWKKAQGDAAVVVREEGPPVIQISLAPDAKNVLALQEDGTALSFNVETKERKELPGRYTSLARSPAGNVILTTKGGEGMVVSPEGEVLRSHKLSSGRRILCESGDNEVLEYLPQAAGIFEWYDFKGGRLRTRDFSIPNTDADWWYFRDIVRIDKAGKRAGFVLIKGLMTSAMWRYMVVDLDSGKTVVDRTTTDLIDSLEFDDSDGSVFVRNVTRKHIVRIDLTNNRPERAYSVSQSLVGPSLPVNGGRYIFSASKGSEFLLTNLESEATEVVAKGADMRGVVFDMASASLVCAASGASGELRLWHFGSSRVEVEPEERVEMSPGGGLQFDMSPSGNLYSVSGSRERSVILKNGLSSAYKIWNDGRYAFGFDESDTIAFVADSDGAVEAIKLGEEGTPLWKQQVSSAQIWNSTYEWRSGKIAISSNEGAVTVLSGRDGQVISKFKACSGSPIGFLLSNDGRYLFATGEDYFLSKWDTTLGTRTASILLTYPNGAPLGLSSICSSPNGKTLVAIPMGNDNRDLVVLDPNSLRILRILSIDTGSVWSATFSSDGRRLICGTSRSALRLIDTTSWDELPPIDLSLWNGDSRRQLEGVYVIEFAERGRRCAAVFENGEVLALDW